MVGQEFSSVTLRDFPAGPALITLFANGIPSESAYTVVKQVTPGLSGVAPGSVSLGDETRTMCPCSEGFEPSGNDHLQALRSP